MKRDDVTPAQVEPSSPGAQRHDAAQKLSGEATYAFDVVLPGMLHAKLLRSPHAHARILRIDCTRARALPGVHLVATSTDMPLGPEARYGVLIRDQPLLNDGKLRYVGDPVAAVVAEDEAIAARALALILVDYEVLPAVHDLHAAQQPDAPALFDAPQPGVKPPDTAGSIHLKEPAHNVLYEYRYAHGAIDDEFARCDHVFEDSFSFSRIHHLHLEPHVTVAAVGKAGVELWVCNQDPFVLRRDISTIFGMPEHHIRIHTPWVGGGFGGKSFCKMEPLVVQLARLAGRPVRLCLTLDESFLTLSQHPARMTMTTGVMAEGTLVARRSQIELDAGAYSDASALVTIKAGYRAAGPYRWRAVDSVAKAIRTTTVPAGSFRGFGGTQVNFASESQLDMIARRLGLDPWELRARNLLDPGVPYMPGDSVIDSRLADGLRVVQQALGRPSATANDDDRWQTGIGFALGFKDAGGVNHASQAVLKISAGGYGVLAAATVEIGQGASTVLPQIAAEVLGMSHDRIRYGEIDTDYTPLDHGTHVSSGTTIMGRAVMQAAEDVRAQVLRFAATQLGTDVSELTLRDWRIHHRGEVHDLEAMIRRVHGEFAIEYIGRGQFQMPLDASAPLGTRCPFWIFNWVGAEVRVDRETGRIEVTRLIAAVDAGRAINPVLCKGQIEGGLLQGYAQALFEEMRFDGALPLNLSPLEYRVPTTRDLPDEMASLVLEHGLGPGPQGAKGIGEAGILGVAAALANAVEDASGVRITTLPITAHKVAAGLGLLGPAVNKNVS